MEENQEPHEGCKSGLDTGWVPNNPFFINIDLCSCCNNEINQETFVELFIHTFGGQLFRARLCWDAGNKNKKADIQPVC